MDEENCKSRRRRFRRWFRRKRRSDPYSLPQVSAENEDDDSLDDVFIRPAEMDPTLTNELRIFVGTWNVGGRSPVGSLDVDLDEWLDLKDAADMYVLGFQEIVPLITRNVIGAEDPTEATNWNMLIGKTLNDKYGCPWLTPLLNPICNENYVGISDERRVSLSSRNACPVSEPPPRTQYQPDRCSKYKLIASKKLVGVFLSVWMKKELLRKYCISDVRVCSVACGIMGCLGNKGSVSVSMSIEGTSFCFIAAHLASGEKKGDEVRRNQQVSEIFRRTSFARSPKDANNSHPLTIFGHDQIFWFGDLNYRLYLEDNLARQLIEKKDWGALQEYDQLRREQEYSGVFQGWREGNIEFAPTYKYSTSNCNSYSGGLPSRSGEKRRTPAWCDRILWYGKGVTQLSYLRSESKFSDHRPVSAIFSTQIELVKSINPRVNTLSVFPNITPPSQTGQSKGDQEIKPTLLSLIAEGVEASSTQYINRSNS